MKTKIWLPALMIALLVGIWNIPLLPEAETQIKYFRLDSIKKITGEVLDIKTEQCYKGDNFTVIYLKEKSTDRQYKVEVAPAWFFDLDIKKRGLIMVTGSYMQMGQDHIIMTQELEYEGKIVNYRDNLGFPLWRGKGKMKGRSGGRGQGRGRGRF